VPRPATAVEQVASTSPRNCAWRARRDALRATGSQTAARLSRRSRTRSPLAGSDCGAPALDPIGAAGRPPDFRPLEQQHVAAAWRGAGWGFRRRALAPARPCAGLLAVIRVPMVSTLHVRPGCRRCTRSWSAIAIGRLSRFGCRTPVQTNLNYVATVYNGVRLEKFRWRPRKTTTSYSPAGYPQKRGCRGCPNRPPQ